MLPVDDTGKSEWQERYEHYQATAVNEERDLYWRAADRLADMGSVPVERVTEREIRNYMRRQGWG